MNRRQPSRDPFKPPIKTGLLVSGSTATAFSLTRVFAPGELDARRVSFVLGVSATAYAARWLVHVVRQPQYRQRGTGLGECGALQAVLGLMWFGTASTYQHAPWALESAAVALLLGLVSLEVGITGAKLKRTEVPLGSVDIRGARVMGESLRDVFGLDNGTAVAQVTRTLNTPMGSVSGLMSLLLTILLSVFLLTWSSNASAKAQPRAPQSPNHTTAPANKTATSVSLPVAPPADATYDDECGSSRLPGRGAPAWASGLRELVLGHGGLGADIAGCAGTVELLSAAGEVVAVERGYDADGDLVSILTCAERHVCGAAIGPAATFLSSALDSGEAWGLGPRTSLGSGDGYLVIEPLGVGVLLRRELNSNASAAPYVYLDPSMAAAWMTAVKVRGVLLWPTSSGHRVGLIYSDGATAGSVTPRLVTLGTGEHRTRIEVVPAARSDLGDKALAELS